MSEFKLKNSFEDVKNNRVVPGGLLKTGVEYFAKDPKLGGELLASIGEACLLEIDNVDQLSTENDMIKLIIQPSIPVILTFKKKRIDCIISEREKEIRNLSLDVIAKLVAENYTQQEIADYINSKKLEKREVSQQTISYRIGKINREYPDLYPEDYKGYNPYKDGTSIITDNTNDDSNNFSDARFADYCD